MVNDEEVSKAAQPFGKHHTSWPYGVDFAPLWRLDENTLPGRAASGARAAEMREELALDGQPERPLQAREMAVEIGQRDFFRGV